METGSVSSIRYLDANGSRLQLVRMKIELNSASVCKASPTVVPIPGQGDEAVSPMLRRFTAQEILGGASEVEIELHGAVYRLRLTSQGKLILTK